MNPVRAGMVDHPAKYRWSSYVANAQGVDNAVIQAHKQYLVLGDTPENQQAAYRGLCEIKADNECFKQQVGVMVGRKVGLIKPGRLRHSDSP
jgi:putative transposase